jgi:hypothetical protein
VGLMQFTNSATHVVVNPLNVAFNVIFFPEAIPKLSVE